MIKKEDLLILRPGDTLQTAAKQMSDERVNSVLLGKDKIVGIVTSTDILKQIGAKHSSALKQDLKSFMSKKLISIRDNKSTDDAIKMMKAEKVHHLLVEDKNQNIVGLISAFDLIKEKALDIQAHPWIRS